MNNEVSTYVNKTGEGGGDLDVELSKSHLSHDSFLYFGTITREMPGYVN